MLCIFISKTAPMSRHLRHTTYHAGSRTVSFAYAMIADAGDVSIAAASSG